MYAASYKKQNLKINSYSIKRYSSMTMGRDDYLFMIPIIQPNR